MKIFGIGKKTEKQAEPKAEPSPAPSDAAKQRLQRLEELQRELDTNNGLKRAYAIQTLLSLLWIATSQSRPPIAFTLFDYPSTSDKANGPAAPLRFCRCLCIERDGEIAPPPAAEGLNSWASTALNSALNETLNYLGAATQSGSARTARTDETEIKREVEICLDLLKVVRWMGLPDGLPPCVRLLKLFPSDLGRRVGAAARQTTLLREAASQAIGAMPPDAILPFWDALGGTEARARRDLMPALDYLVDARAIPHLAALLEQRKAWVDGEMLGWFIVRSFGRIGSRKALPALRLVSSEDKESGLGLAQEARRVIQAIEDGKATRDRNELLRPAETTSDTLLRSAFPPQTASLRDRNELLRPGEDTEKTENRKHTNGG